MKKLTIFAVLLALAPAGMQGQRPEQSAYQMEQSGFVLDDGGEWQAPTHATALAELLAEEPNMAPAVAFLRQTHSARSTTELESFADELVRVILEGTEEQVFEARVTLLVAADSRWPNQAGTRYAGSVDAFIKLYNSYEESSKDARFTLSAIQRVGGTNFLVDLLNSVEVPPPCEHPQQLYYLGMEPPPPPENPCPNVSVWCDAGRALLDTPHSPDRTLYRDRCAQNIRF